MSDDEYLSKNTLNNKGTKEEYEDRVRMQDALTAIAQELQRFHDTTYAISTQDFTDNEEILNKLMKCKSMLNFKNKLIKKLKENVKIACMVAKTMMSMKDNESTSLNNHLKFARSECADMYQKNKNTTQVIKRLTIENNSLRNELENLANFIELGYKELQKIRDESCDDLSVVMQLKKIIVCCGQYYADHCNEYEKNTGLEQKNRFLSSQLNILNNNLEAVSDELKSLQYQNTRLRKEIAYLKAKGCKGKPFKNFGLVYSACKIEDQHDYVNLSTTKVEFLTKIRNLDLTTHLTIVKKLLEDQDDVLKDLECLSKIVTSNGNLDAP